MTFKAMKVHLNDKRLFTVSHGVWLCAVLVFLPAASTLAQLDESFIRVQYANTYELPDGDSFIITLSFLDSAEEEVPDFAVSSIHRKMGLSREAAKEFREMLSSVHRSIEEDIKQRQYNLGCDNGTPKFYGEDVYKALEDIEDADGVVAGEHYSALLESLDPDIAGRLNQWIQDRKLNTSQTKFWKKKTYERSGHSADAVLARLCLMLAEEQ